MSVATMRRAIAEVWKWSAASNNDASFKLGCAVIVGPCGHLGLGLESVVLDDILLLIYNLFFATLVHAQENLNRTGSNGTYPTTFRATGFNSTESELKVGTTPIVPFGEIIKNDPWSTPLVDGCPKLCSVVGSNPSNWTHVHDQKLLARCEEPFLFSLNVQNDPDQFATIRTCALKAGKAESKRQYIDTIWRRLNSRSLPRATAAALTRHLRKPFLLLDPLAL